MRVKFLQNLGSDDTHAIKRACGVNVNHKDCTIGAVVNLPDEAAEWLSAKYKALFEVVEVKGEAKKPDLTGTAK